MHRKSMKTAIWCTSCGAYEGPHGSSTKATFAKSCKGNPRWWAGPARQKQLERFRQGMHPTLDIPLGPEVSCSSLASTSERANLDDEQTSRRRAWVKAEAMNKTKSSIGKNRPTKAKVGDDFYTVAYDRAERRDPIRTSENELAAQRRFATNLDHVDRDIAELERPCKIFKSNLFLLPRTPSRYS